MEEKSGALRAGLRFATRKLFLLNRGPDNRANKSRWNVSNASIASKERTESLNDQISGAVPHIVELLSEAQDVLVIRNKEPAIVLKS